MLRLINNGQNKNELGRGDEAVFENKKYEKLQLSIQKLEEDIREPELFTAV